MELRRLYDGLERNPADYPLFARIWEVLTLAPSSKHANEEEMVSLACDALDYLQTNGEWSTASTTGRTTFTWDGQTLEVHEDDDRSFEYQHEFEI